jgi:hypothetical protein
MKYIKFKFSSICLVLVLTALVSCDSITGDPDLPIPLDETLSNTGAFLRIISTESAAFDLAEPSNASYQIEVEYFDGEGSSLLENVEFYAAYESFGLKPEDRTSISETENPVFVVPASEFTENDNGLPSATISIPLAEVTDGLGLDISNVGVEDRFDIRWVVNLTDGRSFSASDASPAIGGGFYDSPYAARVFTVQALDPSEFTGTYLFEAQGTGVFGWQTFSSSFTAELSIDEDNTLNGRVFTAEPYAEDWGGLTPIDVPIALGRTATVSGSSNGITTGLGCTLSLAVGPITDSANNGVIIDLADDSQFTLVLGDNVRGACGVGPTDVAYTVTKQ